MAYLEELNTDCVVIWVSNLEQESYIYDVIEGVGALTQAKVIVRLLNTDSEEW